MGFVFDEINFSIVDFTSLGLVGLMLSAGMASSSVEDVELGFAEDPEDNSKLTSAYLPSKIGGKPAWLDPRLPIPEDLVCKKCNKPRVFLLQLYAPIDHLTHCYHRTLYMFCCREPFCHSRSCAEPFLVLRCTLPQSNSSKIVGVARDEGVINSKDGNNSTDSIENNGCLTDAHDDSASEAVTNTLHSAGDAAFSNRGDKDVSDEHLMQDQQQKGLESNLSLLLPLCIVCGCSGPKRCSKCHSVNYCSREHQVIHWKAGHKKHCGDEKQPITSDEVGGILFKEFEIVTEPEPPIKITPEKSEEERLKDYHKFLEHHSGKFDSAEMDKMCLDEVGKGVRKDKQFMAFKKRIAVEPDQVCMCIFTVVVQLLIRWGKV